MRRERGFAICRGKGGRITKGPSVVGEAHSVSVPLRCPVGSQVIGVHHHHPGGSLQLSPQDIQTGRERGLEHICVEANGKTKCYRFGSGRK